MESNGIDAFVSDHVNMVVVDLAISGGYSSPNMLISGVGLDLLGLDNVSTPRLNKLPDLFPEVTIIHLAPMLRHGPTFYHGVRSECSQDVWST